MTKEKAIVSEKGVSESADYRSLECGVRVSANTTAWEMEPNSIAIMRLVILGD
jgi:hypothetical protein